MRRSGDVELQAQRPSIHAVALDSDLESSTHGLQYEAAMKSAPHCRPDARIQ